MAMYKTATDDVLTVRITRDEVAKAMEEKGVRCDARRIASAKNAAMVPLDRMAQKFKADAIELIARSASNVQERR